MEKYSVLMSVYYKEKPEYLRAAIDSMLNQTVKPDDFVLVCDGPLTEELDKVVTCFEQNYPQIFNVIRLEKNQGLGNALNIGLKECKNELIARMDSDDISCNERCEKQLFAFEKNDSISVMSGTVSEFSETPDLPVGKRKLPVKHKDILEFSKKRNPFNHPAVMFKKTEVEKCGGYSEKFPLFEDYYLWIRMMKNGAIGMNLQDCLLNMRATSDMYMRRGGIDYAKKMLKFHKWLLKSKWIKWFEYCIWAIPHAFVCIMPNWLRKSVYKRLRN